jgi:hypothetical protein
MDKIASGWLQRLHRATIDMFAVNPLTRKFQGFKARNDGFQPSLLGYSRTLLTNSEH